MKFLNSGNIVRLPLDEIAVEGRLREVRDTFVESLMLMAEDTGITTPIHVRKVQGRYVLIDGAHRLEAARRMGLEDIAALSIECRADEARAMEASNNLGAARMTPLQTAVFVASWKRDYYTMHPERKPGVFKGNQHTGSLVEVTMTSTTNPTPSTASLTETIADAFGVSESTIKRALEVGERLTPEEAADLDRAPVRITMKDLRDLSKIGIAAERGEVIAQLSAGKAKNVAAARKAANPSPPAPPKDPVDEAFVAMQKLWARAPMAAKRRFAEERWSEISRLMRDSATDADEVAE